MLWSTNQESKHTCICAHVGVCCGALTKRANTLAYVMQLLQCPVSGTNYRNLTRSGLRTNYKSLPIFVFIKADQLCGTRCGPVNELTHAMLTVDTFSYLEQGGRGWGESRTVPLK